MPRQRKKTKFSFNVFAVQLFILLILLILADLFLWAAAPIPSGGIREKRFTQNQPGLKREIVYQIDDNGLRALSPIEPEKPGNLIRILCLGASTTDQSTQETGDTWCGILEANLREHYKDSSVKFQTMAFGRGGFRAIDSALWLEDHMEKIKPDIVVTLLGINDLCWNGGPDYQPRNIDRIVEEKRGLTWRFLLTHVGDKCREYSQVYRRVSAIITVYRNKMNLRSGRFVEWHSSNLPERRQEYREAPFVDKPFRNPDPIDEFKLSVNWLADFLEKRGIPVVLLGQPVLWKESSSPEELDRLWLWVNTAAGRVRPPVGWLHAEMQRYNRVQESLAKGDMVKYFDLDPRIPKTLEYFFDDCHYTDLGSILVAKSVLPVLIETTDSLLLKRHMKHSGNHLP